MKMCEDCYPIPDFSKLSEVELQRLARLAGFKSVNDWVDDLLKPSVFEILSKNTNKKISVVKWQTKSLLLRC